ncbi:MAG: hypothetical protein HY985_14585 [Magnetospirillum sp.]|nr:hypothetical protein [Magnetospirillum sp.]
MNSILQIVVAAATVGSTFAQRVLVNISGDMKPTAAIGLAVGGVAAASIGKVLISGLGKAAFTTIEKASIVGGKKIAVAGAEKAAISGIGKITAGKTAVASITAREAAISSASYEAKESITKSTTAAIEKNCGFINTKETPYLFHKYEHLSVAINDPNRLRAFIKNNPSFIDDASLDLYKAKPEFFADDFNSTIVASKMKGTFRDAIHAKISERNMQTANELAEVIASGLKRNGISITSLGSTRTELDQAIDRFVKVAASGKSDYKWGYKSGAVFVKGDVGHFSFEQEVSISSIIKATAAGAVAISASNIDWKKDSFVQIKSCIGNFCLDIDSKNKSATKKAPP